MLHTEQGLKDILENQKSIFYLLSQEEKEEIRHHVSFTQYKKNEFIFKEGDKPNGLLVLADGKVKIFKEGVGGREQIIRMAKPLGVIGFRALLANETHIASAVTIEESVICTVSQEFMINYALEKQ